MQKFEIREWHLTTKLCRRRRSSRLSVASHIDLHKLFGRSPTSQAKFRWSCPLKFQPNSRRVLLKWNRLISTHDAAPPTDYYNMQVCMCVSCKRAMIAVTARQTFLNTFRWTKFVKDLALRPGRSAFEWSFFSLRRGRLCITNPGTPITQSWTTCQREEKKYFLASIYLLLEKKYNPVVEV